ncbi:MAG: hypothetical protein CM1200mP2_04450 [Planctomycetaceae bacterium]|nr:MAG: hypothetical protein CM1200mP2_04450 [Planctomycetaceae bacterium]
MTTPGDPVPSRIAPSADIRSDLPRFRVWEHGKVIDEPTDVPGPLAGGPLVGFLIGCSFTFEAALLKGGWKSAPGMRDQRADVPNLG